MSLLPGLAMGLMDEPSSDLALRRLRVEMRRVEPKDPRKLSYFFVSLTNLCAAFLSFLNGNRISWTLPNERSVITNIKHM